MSDPLAWLDVCLAFASKSRTPVLCAMYVRALTTAVGLRRARDSWRREALRGFRLDRKMYETAHADCVRLTKELAAAQAVLREVFDALTAIPGNAHVDDMWVVLQRVMSRLAAAKGKP